MKFFKKESRLVEIMVDGAKQWIGRETQKVFDNLELKPTPVEPMMGICNTCNEKNAVFQKKFINQLVNFEDENSCFMLAHDVEPLAGIAWKETDEYKLQNMEETVSEMCETARFWWLVKKSV